MKPSEGTPHVYCLRPPYGLIGIFSVVPSGLLILNGITEALMANMGEYLEFVIVPAIFSAVFLACCSAYLVMKDKGDGAAGFIAWLGLFVIIQSVLFATIGIGGYMLALFVIGQIV